MTDKELIKQEIERRVEETPSTEGAIALESLLDYINSISEETASEDLEEEIKQVAMDFEQVEVAWNKDFDFIARHFAEWQKQKDQETIELAEDHAMLAGMMKEREEMMKDAVEAEVFVDYNINFGYGSLTANIDLDEQHLKEGDKVKIIIVKTEQQ